MSHFSLVANQGRGSVNRSPQGAIRGGGEIIEVYPGATLRTMGLASYKSRPDEAVRLGIAACAAAGIKLDVDLRLVKEWEGAIWVPTITASAPV